MQILKFQLPYKIIVPEGYSILYQDPFYHFRKEIKCLSGVVEADKWGFVAFPFSLEQSDFYLEAGTPLVHCFVFKRESEKIFLIKRSGTDEEYEHIRKQVQLQTISPLTTRRTNLELELIRFSSKKNQLMGSCH